MYSTAIGLVMLGIEEEMKIGSEFEPNKPMSEAQNQTEDLIEDVVEDVNDEESIHQKPTWKPSKYTGMIGGFFKGLVLDDTDDFIK